MSCARIKNRPVKFLDPQQKLITELRDEIRRLRIENRNLRSSLLSAPSELQRYANDMIELAHHSSVTTNNEDEDLDLIDPKALRSASANVETTPLSDEHKKKSPFKAGKDKSSIKSHPNTMKFGSLKVRVF